MGIRLSTPSVDVPALDWRVVRNRVNKLWVADDAPHHSIISETRGGKSYLITRGLLPLCEQDRVLIIDNKGGDPTLRGYGKPVRKLSRFDRAFRGNKPRSDWYRLIVHEDYKSGREQVRQILSQIYDEGNWIVVMDELRAVTASRPPNLGLEGEVGRLYLRGGSRGISVISSTQEPVWVPSFFYSQASFAWIGRVEDEERQKRLRQIAGLTRDYMPVISSTPRRHWLYVDTLEDEKFIAQTTVSFSQRGKVT